MSKNRDVIEVDPEQRDRDLRLIARCIDLTTLSGIDTVDRVEGLCAAAMQPDPNDSTVGPVAAVCVYPSLAPTAISATQGSAVRVASVAGAFPDGLSPLNIRLAEIGAVVDFGVDEVDIVLNRAAFLEGRFDDVRNELEASRAAAAGTTLKVILEVDDLASPEAIRNATALVLETGADFVKTSTGKTGAGATPEAVEVICEGVAEYVERTGRTAGVKVSGGVRTAEDALSYVSIVRRVLGEEWLTPDRFRIGASSLLADVVATIAQG